MRQFTSRSHRAGGDVLPQDILILPRSIIIILCDKKKLTGKSIAIALLVLYGISLMALPVKKVPANFQVIVRRIAEDRAE